MSNKLKIGISIGDINGIGLEVILKTLSNQRILEYCTPIVYGHTKLASFHRKANKIPEMMFNVITHPDQAHGKKLNLINCWQEDVKIELGVANELGGKYAFLSLKNAVQDLKDGAIDALVTAPINKNTIQSEEFQFPGHTEYLQQEAGVSDVLMFLVNDELRVGVATGHIPVNEVAKQLSKEGIVKKLKLMNESLKKDFWIDKPRIAVLGLNPHAGDNGLIGKEEQQTIIPAIEEANAQGVFCFGPYPADGFFGKGSYQQFDAVLAMYHDQGLIPFKTLAFGSGVNFTAGLPFVRTSPDHGTGFDIAGQNKANHGSFCDALFMALKIIRNRNEQKELTANPLKTNSKIIESADDQKDDAE